MSGNDFFKFFCRGRGEIHRYRPTQFFARPLIIRAIGLLLAAILGIGPEVIVPCAMTPQRPIWLFNSSQSFFKAESN